ncbi:hypothetical protein Ga0466249_000940 [Sporomusaceae bacterium BoRhaA]|nr:hypothetical protein [Pelorhabdus rhamnosifermentans]
MWNCNKHKNTADPFYKWKSRVFVRQVNNLVMYFIVMIMTKNRNLPFGFINYYLLLQKKEGICI